MFSLHLKHPFSVRSQTGTFGCEDLNGLTFCIIPAITPGCWRRNTLVQLLTNCPAVRNLQIVKVLSSDHVYLFACLRFFVRLGWICRIMRRIALWHLKKNVYWFKKKHYTNNQQNYISYYFNVFYLVFYQYCNCIYLYFWIKCFLWFCLFCHFYSFDLWWLMLTFMSLHLLFSHHVWKRSYYTNSQVQAFIWGS